MDNNASSLNPIGELLHTSTKTTADNAGLLLGVWACCHLPTQILGFIVGMTSSLTSQEDVRAAMDVGDYAALAPLMVLGLLGFVLGTLAYAATVMFAARALRAQPITFPDLMIAAIKRMIPVGIASLLIGAACGLGVMFLVVPGIYLLVRFCLAISATCVDELGPVESLRRSWALTQGRFWDVAAFLAVLFCVGLAAAAALVVVGGILVAVGSLAGAPGRALTGMIANAAQFLISSWGAVCLTKFYLDLSERGSAQP